MENSQSILKVRRKPTDMMACQYNGTNLEAIRFLVGFSNFYNRGKDICVYNPSNGRWSDFNISDYVMMIPITGMIYVVSEDDFKKHYEVISAAEEITKNEGLRSTGQSEGETTSNPL